MLTFLSEVQNLQQILQCSLDYIVVSGINNKNQMEMFSLQIVLKGIINLYRKKNGKKVIGESQILMKPSTSA